MNSYCMMYSAMSARSDNMSRRSDKIGFTRPSDSETGLEPEGGMPILSSLE